MIPVIVSCHTQSTKDTEDLFKTNINDDIYVFYQSKHFITKKKKKIQTIILQSDYFSLISRKDRISSR